MKPRIESIEGKGAVFCSGLWYLVRSTCCIGCFHTDYSGMLALALVCMVGVVQLCFIVVVLVYV